MLLKVKNKILAFLITITGFAISCTKSAYGTPYARYVINGKVVDNETGEGIKNIKVLTNIKKSQEDTSVFLSIESYTNTTGDFQVKHEGGYYLTSKRRHHFQIKDIDSTVNGLYQNKEETIFFGEPKYENGGSWDFGTSTENIEFRLNTTEK